MISSQLLFSLYILLLSTYIIIIIKINIINQQRISININLIISFYLVINEIIKINLLWMTSSLLLLLLFMLSLSTYHHQNKCNKLVKKLIHIYLIINIITKISMIFISIKKISPLFLPLQCFSKLFMNDHSSLNP